MKSEKNYKNLRNIIVIVIAIILLIVAAYAWFTSNKTTTISNLDVSVNAVDGMEISVNASNWKTMITKSELNTHTGYTSAINQLPTTLFPVSTTGNIDTSAGTLNLFSTELTINDEDGYYRMTATKETDTAGTSGNYMAFDVFIKTSKTTGIALSPKSKIYSVKTGTSSTSTGIEHATRIAILNQGNVKADASIDSRQGLKGATDARIIEPHYNSHTATGVENAKSTYGITDLTIGTANERVVYKGIKAPIETGVKLNSEDENYFASISSKKSSTVTGEITDEDGITYVSTAFFSGSTNQNLLKLEEGINKLRIYIWIEGQDVDCENSASGATLYTSLQFVGTDIT